MRGISYFGHRKRKHDAMDTDILEEHCFAVIYGYGIAKFILAFWIFPNHQMGNILIVSSDRV